MHLHQVLVGASPGDAVTSIAHAIEDLLAGVVPTSTWAYHLDPRCSPRIRPIWEMPPPEAAGPDDVVIYHLSIGEPDVADFVHRRPEKLVVHYHNITPSSYFTELDPHFARLLAAGRSELRELVARADLVFADSRFNADEVASLSSVPVRVTPPPIDHGALTRVEPDAPTLHHFEAVVDVPMILHVGQLLPHKRPEVLVGAMHILTFELGVPAAMVILGPTRNRDYSWAVQAHISDLGLSNVWMAGERSVGELAAFFRSATLFATASVHEGFCVPVVEAFHFDLPVVARGVTALPDTVGDGGLLLPPDAGPSLFAEAFADILRSPSPRDAFAAGRRRRVEELSVDRSRAAMLSALHEVLGA